MINEGEQSNYETFRDCLGDALIQHLNVHEQKTKNKKSKANKHRRKSSSVTKTRVHAEVNEDVEGPISDASELGEFIEVLISLLDKMHLADCIQPVPCL